MKQFLKVLCFTAFFIMLSGTYYAKASSGIDLTAGLLQPTEMADYYFNRLNSTQQDICSYLVGCYNSIYLGARGFIATDNTFTSSSNFIATAKSFGVKVFGFMLGASSWASRFNQTLCQYISSCIVYSMQQNYSTFDAWYSDLDTNFYIPYSDNLLSAWDTFYNDNSNDGIASFGSEVSNWNSGTLYDFAFVGVPFSGSYDENLYNNFIINNSPVLYSSPTSSYQYMYSFKNIVYPTVLVFSSLDGLNYNYRYCTIDQDGLHTVNNQSLYGMIIEKRSNGKLTCSTGIIANNIWGGVLNINTTDFSSFVNEAFLKTPIRDNNGNINSQNNGCYYLLTRVFQVDNIYSLSNPREIFNVDQFHISSDSDVRYVPQNDFNFNVNISLPDNNQFYKLLIINTYDDNDEPVDPDDGFKINLNPLNYPDSNSYYKPYSPDSPLPSFDIGLFGDAGGQITYFKECAEKFIIYTRQVLDCFSFNDGEEGPALIIVAVLIIGIAGGLVVKMLL